MVRVELEDVVVSVGGCVDIDCEEIFKVLRVASAFFSLLFSFLKNQNFFKAEFVCVCVCVCVCLTQMKIPLRSCVQVLMRERKCD